MKTSYLVKIANMSVIVDNQQDAWEWVQIGLMHGFIPEAIVYGGRS